jgi:hypothetical protein
VVSSCAGVLAFISEHRAVGHDFQVGQLGEAIHDALRDSVAQVFRVWTAPHVDERQNRKG